MSLHAILLALFLWILTKALWSDIWDLELAVSKMTQIIPASYLTSFVMPSLNAAWI